MMRYDIDAQLIQSVSRNPRLYDKSLASNNTLSRREAWMVVAQECNLHMEVCQARWKTLRDRYVREINKPSSKGFALLENFHFLRRHINSRRKCASNASDPQSISYYIDDMTQDEAPSSMIMQQEQVQVQREEQEQVQVQTEVLEHDQEYLSENADTSSVEFVAEETINANENPSEHPQPPLPANNNTTPAMEHLSAFAKVINMLEQALKEKSKPAELQDPFYKYLESILSRVDERTRGDIQLRVLNFVHDEIKKAEMP